LGDIRKDRHLHCLFEAAVHGQLGHRFRKNHVGACVDARLGALDRPLNPFNRQCIGARHDDKAGIRACIDRGLDPIDHLLLWDNLFAGTVPTALGLNLILNMQPGGTGLDKGTHGTCNVKGPAPPRVGVDQQRQG
jgi:hypothetical protein